MFKFYNKNGELWDEGIYIAGERDGFKEVYDSSDRLLERGVYKYNNRYGLIEIFDEYYNQLEEKGIYKGGVRDGLFDFYYTGNKYNQYSGIDYYKGQLMPKERGIYRDGKREGLWEFYHQTGKLKYRRVYEAGEIIEANSPQIEYTYYDNGQLKDCWKL